MRSYGQYCGLAKALDVVGDRWTLLIVRELLTRPGCRYTDLQKGLPGIATNLLANRLRELEEAGIVEREEAPAPIAATLFRLTARGRELEGAVRALGLWGAPLLAKADRKDTFQPHWLLLPLTMLLRDRLPEGRPVSVELRTGGEAVVVEAEGGKIRARMGAAAAQHADVVLTGHPGVLLGVLTGKMALATAIRSGMSFQGDAEILGHRISGNSVDSFSGS
jgi:DNA-binding HxlR family transcriptional regulator